MRQLKATLARSRPTPSLPHTPRAPLLVSSTLLEARSQCICAASRMSAARGAPHCRLCWVRVCHWTSDVALPEVLVLGCLLNILAKCLGGVETQPHVHTTTSCA